MSVIVSSAADFAAMDLSSLVAMSAHAICSRPLIHMTLAIAILLLSTAQINTSRYGLVRGSNLCNGLSEKSDVSKILIYIFV